MRCIVLPPDRYFTTRLGVGVKEFMSTYLGHTMPLVQEPPRARRRSPRRDEETEAAILPAPFEDIAVDAEELEPLEASLERLDAGQDDEED